jgi:hypothetical protein
LCDNISLESVTFSSSGGGLENAALDVVETFNNKGLDSTPTHSSQKGIVRLHFIGNEVNSKEEA